MTISGLDLGDTRSSVTSDLEHLDYRHFSTGTWSEHFYRMDSPNIEVVYDETDSVHRLEGGVPEIDGVDASRWSLAEIEQALGPCPRAGSSGAVGGEDRAVLSYPQHRLLIYMEKSGNRFILFESGRS